LLPMILFVRSSWFIFCFVSDSHRIVYQFDRKSRVPGSNTPSARVPQWQRYSTSYQAQSPCHRSLDGILYRTQSNVECEYTSIWIVEYH
jgi:hypothetical protein